MLASHSTAERRPSQALHRSLEIASTPEAAFALVCEVEKWPVWLSFLKSARVLNRDAAFGLGSEVALRSAIPGEAEECYEVDRFLDGHIVSLVGAFSLRRRVEFRIERHTLTSKIVVRIDYPSYGGVLGALIDRMTARRRLDTQLGDSLLHFKGLVEFENAAGEALGDF